MGVVGSPYKNGTSAERQGVIRFGHPVSIHDVARLSVVLTYIKIPGCAPSSSSTLGSRGEDASGRKGDTDETYDGDDEVCFLCREAPGHGACTALCRKTPCWRDMRAERPVLMGNKREGLCR